MEVIKINDNYNVIRLIRDKMCDYYLEKVGYGNLMHIFSYEYQNKDDLIVLNKGYVYKAIEIAKKDRFWID